MKLPWIPLYLDAYIGDTLHLTTEQHGAYFLIMLAYYKSERALPAADEALAAITRTSVERWRQIKPVLAPFFDEKDDRWHHARMDEEIEKRLAKHADSVKRAKSGASARWGDKPPTPKKTKDVPEALPQALQVGNSPDDAHSTLNNTTPPPARAREEISIQEVEEAQEPQAPDPGVGSPISEDWLPDPDWVSETVSDSDIPLTAIDQQVKMFIAHYQESGAFSNNWDASWTKWWQRELDWLAKQAKKRAPKPTAPPRIVLDAEHAPSTKDWEFGLKMFTTGGQWPRTLGPEPDLSGCKCPPELMIKFGLDPVTGLKK